LTVLNSSPVYNKPSVFAKAGYNYAAAHKPGITEKQQTGFTSFINNKPHSAWIADKKGNLLYANAAFYTCFGIDKVAGNTNLYDCIPAQWGNTLAQKHMQVAENKTAQSFQQKIIHANGNEEVFLVTLFLFDNGPDNFLISGDAIPITPLHYKTPAAKNDGGNLLQLNHPASTANWEWNMATNHIYHNAAMQQLIGFCNTTAKNLSWWFSRIHTEDCKKVRDSIKNVLDNLGHNWVCEYRFKNKNGQYIMVRDRGFVIYEDGQPVRMVGSFKDITQIKQQELTGAEEKINEQKNIAESFLNIQEKEKDRISYELNENINQILAAAKMFIESIAPANTDGQENINMAAEYVSMGMKEIKKLYKEMLMEQPLLEKGLVSNINMLVGNLKSDVDVKVICNFTGDIEALDPSKQSTLFRIVQEQFKNIARHSKAKLVRIEIRITKEYVQVMIKDDGMGFNPGEITWGIGFSSIHQRAKLYNGSVCIKTSTGKEGGCKMVVKIPLAG
jgi:PAS domain S-box-containing protein